MTSGIDRQLDYLLAQYLSRWGPVSWREEIRRVNVDIDLDLGNVLLALSAIETDSKVIHRKLHTANLDHRKAIKEFNICWLAEEAEHGRALRSLAERLGVYESPQERNSRRSVRAAVAWPALAASRVGGQSLEATYFALGAVQEYVALTTYRKVADIINDVQAALILRRIATQESRHMRFYRGAALIFLENPKCAYIAAQLIRRLWRPPGIDLLGAPAWLRAFRPLLEDDLYRARLIKIDKLIQKMPGFEGAQLMEGFLSRHGYSSIPLAHNKLVTKKQLQAARPMS